jgi:hypothetical protein
VSAEYVWSGSRYGPFGEILSTAVLFSRQWNQCFLEWLQAPATIESK